VLQAQAAQSTYAANVVVRGNRGGLGVPTESDRSFCWVNASYRPDFPLANQATPLPSFPSIAAGYLMIPAFQSGVSSRACRGL